MPKDFSESNRKKDLQNASKIGKTIEADNLSQGNQEFVRIEKNNQAVDIGKTEAD